MIDATPFCAKPGDPRVYLHTPFRANGYVYATDGAVVVRVDEPAASVFTDVDEEPARSPLRDVVKSIESGLAQPVTQSYQALTIQLPPAHLCRRCRGSGKVTPCDECAGKGCFTHGSHDYECQACDATGDLPADPESNGDICPECDGSGARRHQAVPIGPTAISRRYLALLLTLPDLTIALKDQHMQASRFRFAGGDGLVMSISV